MKIITRMQNDHATVKVEGSLSNENLQELEKKLGGALSKRKHLLLDLGEMTFICSAALGMMLDYNRKYSAGRLRFVLCNLRDDIRKLFVITELHKHLAIFNSAADALSHIRDRAP